MPAWMVLSIGCVLQTPTDKPVIQFVVEAESLEHKVLRRELTGEMGSLTPLQQQVNAWADLRIETDEKLVEDVPRPFVRFDGGDSPLLEPQYTGHFLRLLHRDLAERERWRRHEPLFAALQKRGGKQAGQSIIDEYERLRWKIPTTAPLPDPNARPHILPRSQTDIDQYGEAIAGAELLRKRDAFAASIAKLATLKLPRPVQGYELFPPGFPPRGLAARPVVPQPVYLQQLPRPVRGYELFPPGYPPRHYPPRRIVWLLPGPPPY